MHFVYVMSEKDRDRMLEQGYSLLSEKPGLHVYVFENRKDETGAYCFAYDESDEMDYVLSDTLTF